MMRSGWTTAGWAALIGVETSVSSGDYMAAIDGVASNESRADSGVFTAALEMGALGVTDLSERTI